MKLLNLLLEGKTATAGLNREDLIATYKRLRSIGRELNRKLVFRLTEDVMKEGGRKLGFVRGDSLYSDNEDQTSVLMDYCIYNVCRDGLNAVGQYQANTPPCPELDPNETACVQAMRRASYSVFCVESLEHGFGIMAREIFNGETVVVVDIGISNSALPGLFFASRMLPFDGYSITSGAVIPIGVVAAADRDAWISQFTAAIPRNAQGLFDPASLIRSCLSRMNAPLTQYHHP